MNIACLVPSVLPDMRHLKLLMHADRIIYIIDEPFSRKSQAHRGRIPADGSGAAWLTLPVVPEDKKKPLRHVRIAGKSWIDTFMKTLTSAAGQAVYYDFYEAELRADFENAWQAGLPDAAAESDEAAEMHSFLLPIIQHLNERLFHYLELPPRFAARPEWMSTAGFNASLAQYRASDPLHIWIEPRGSYFRQLGKLPPQAQVSTPEVSLPAYSRGAYAPAAEGHEYSLLDLLFHHGPLSFRVLDLLQA
ncbi:MAG: WbqC family protein [Cyclonatronaceae bacterium]